MEGTVSPVFSMVWSAACWKSSSQTDGGGGGVSRSGEHIESMARTADRGGLGHDKRCEGQGGTQRRHRKGRHLG
jgi:hypothetical protein